MQNQEFNIMAYEIPGTEYIFWSWSYFRKGGYDVKMICRQLEWMPLFHLNRSNEAKLRLYCWNDKTHTQREMCDDGKEEKK